MVPRLDAVKRTAAGGEDTAFAQAGAGRPSRRAVAGLSVQAVDADGRQIDHVDVHPFRRTFATDLIKTGADPKTVQKLLGQRTLTMTMNVYDKVRWVTARQAVSRLSYGAGSQNPAHVVELPRPASQNPHSRIEATG